MHSRLQHGHESMFGLAGHPAAYDRQSRLLGRPIYRRLVNDVLTLNLPSGSSVVDAGTGPGRVPLMLARAAPGLRVEGIDLSPEMVAYAAERAEAAGVGDRVSYQAADVADLPYPDASVDVVVSSLSLHHWADVPGGLREIGRVLKPGGQAWIVDLRRVLAGTAPAIVSSGVTAYFEPRLPNARWFNPLGRLVIS